MKQANPRVFPALAEHVQSSLAIIQLHLHSWHSLEYPSAYLQEALISAILFPTSLQGAVSGKLCFSHTHVQLHRQELRKYLTFLWLSTWQVRLPREEEQRK